MQNAEENDTIYWQIGEHVRRNPDFLIDSETKSQRLVAGGGYVAIEVGFKSIVGLFL